jgi:hypothetical protein
MLNSTATYPECIQNATFNWYIGNNYVGSGLNYVHSFTGNGTYVICLRVAATLPDGAKCEREKCYSVEVTGCDQQLCSCENLHSGFSVETGLCFGQFTSAATIPACMTNLQYLWLINSDYAGSTSSITYDFPASGTYTVCMYIWGTLPDGEICEKIYCQNVTVSCFGGTAPGGGGGYNLNMILYPNPASSDVTVEFDLEEASQVAITLRTTDGKRILSETKAAEAGKQRFNLQIPSSTAEGVILVEIVAGNRTIIRKVEISKH